MELLDYLDRHFYTLQQLLEITQVTEQALRRYQNQGAMPLCSYRLRLDIGCDSFFGPHREQDEIEYYARGYAAWLALLHSLETHPVQASRAAAGANGYPIFYRRYRDAMERLQAHGQLCHNLTSGPTLDAHIEREWTHFLAGTYGLCTRSGLPEDIAAKELAISAINAMTTEDELDSELDEQQRLKLTRAVNLLDEVSAGFAPHERQRSSRHRLVDEMRRRYRLQAQDA
ncbi:DUF6058 family natural product biosynthesis protein [Shewanella salipaludis]|uniref:Uncharacterized protein n=1 Tax=Shewanella salipaludis TaxID=2723052 RepID=A0A972G4L4_9GAMM|nr:DUF6058 family natural product biosynthesis protein [Shewanella salipaludis]NMH64335.1 hypothetical protein [Shewanella salipaludis]